ncbi:MAG: ABC transporter ATP-binding protein [Chloroflexi bacterium]|nr:ABC transporter ATP-binding protein [Chloroflexota bacterium]
MNGPVVRCESVTKRFGDVVAVDNASFALEPGEILSILGPSGCGKTTLLRLIAGFENPDAGEVSVQGRVVFGAMVNVPPDQRNVGLVFQEYALFPHMTVAQNVSFGLRHLEARDRKRRLAEVLQLVRLTGLEDRYPHELSGVEQQRVALARTLAPRPVTLLLDEPFSNLDAEMRSEMRREVEHILRKDNVATVFVTHDREEAFAMADRIGVMKNGHLDQVDTPDVIYHSPATIFVAQLAGTCDFLSGRLYEGYATTDLGALPSVSNNGPMPDGSKVQLLVRPDDFQVLPDPEGTSVVASREFRGDETILFVRMASGDTLRCRQRSDSTLSTGTRVTLVPDKATPFAAFRLVED